MKNCIITTILLLTFTHSVFSQDTVRKDSLMNFRALLDSIEFLRMKLPVEKFSSKELMFKRIEALDEAPSYLTEGTDSLHATEHIDTVSFTYEDGIERLELMYIENIKYKCHHYSFGERFYTFSLLLECSNHKLSFEDYVLKQISEKDTSKFVLFKVTKYNIIDGVSEIPTLITKYHNLFSFKEETLKIVLGNLILYLQ